jgi:hypothetical protein
VVRGVFKACPDEVTVTSGTTAWLLSLTIPLSAPVVATTLCAALADLVCSKTPTSNTRHRSSFGTQPASGDHYSFFRMQ